MVSAVGMNLLGSEDLHLIPNQNKMNGSEQTSPQGLVIIRHHLMLKIGIQW